MENSPEAKNVDFQSTYQPIGWQIRHQSRKTQITCEIKETSSQKNGDVLYISYYLLMFVYCDDNVYNISEFN